MSAPSSPMRWLPLLAFAALAALLFAGVRMVSQDKAADVAKGALPSPLIGKPAPAFELPLLREPARSVTSAQLLGEPYVMNVWGSWCPECRIEHPLLTRLAESGRMRVIGYNLKDEPADALRWLQQFGNPFWLVLTDYSGETAIDWGIYGAPETFLVDADGIVRWKHVGPLTGQVLQTQLLPALASLEAR